ncbi:hypothetical protein TIFTF001_031999 [Ficus carica]|uniref:Thaumatin-like protein n=1 Tax=Ficus carica TaxID=3494 RepID=A0AA88DVX8_FICCA|nr:hypothetical protein TIFTF001_031999 [Ficus carica]
MTTRRAIRFTRLSRYPFVSSLDLCSQAFFVGDPTITLNVINQCNHKVWAAILQNSGSPPIPTSGFSLKPGESKTLSVPTGTWSGRLWGRTRCNHDDAGKFSCVTGDCGTATVECSTGRFTPPVSVAEFFLNSAAGGLDWYDISFVDGFNLPMSVAPTDATSGGWSCSISGCDVDLNRLCPIELRMNHKGQTMACKSSCDARAVPTSCEPKSYSEYFKNLCPRARVYASDRTSLMSCSSLAYDVIFCPSSSSPANNSSSSPANSTG